MPKEPYFCRDESRRKKYITENPHDVEVIGEWFVDDYIEKEKVLLKDLEPKKYRGEWFMLDEEDVAVIKFLCS